MTTPEPQAARDHSDSQTGPTAVAPPAIPDTLHLATGILEVAREWHNAPTNWYVRNCTKFSEAFPVMPHQRPC